jgi:HEAT repeat protein
LLLNALKASADENTHRHAADALGKIGQPCAIQPLIEALSDAEIVVRADAAEALGILRPRAAVKALLKLVKAKEEFADGRYIAAITLAKINDARACEPILNALLSAEDSQVSKFMLSALVELNAARACDVLLQSLSDRNAGIRAAAAHGLGMVGDGKAIEPLQKAAMDTEAIVRVAAARSLAEYRDRERVRILMQLALEDTDQRVQDAAIAGLNKMGAYAVAALQRTQKMGDGESQRMVKQVLEQMQQAKLPRRKERRSHIHSTPWKLPPSRRRAQVA